MDPNGTMSTNTRGAVDLGQPGAAIACKGRRAFDVGQTVENNCRKKVDCTRQSTLDFLGLILPFLNVSFSLSASFSSLIVLNAWLNVFPLTVFCCCIKYSF